MKRTAERGSPKHLHPLTFEDAHGAKPTEARCRQTDGDDATENLIGKQIESHSGEAHQLIMTFNSTCAPPSQLLGVLRRHLRHEHFAMVDHKLRPDPFGWVGHVLAGKVRVDAVVGEGGFGVVYRAWHLGFEQPVALKCLKLKPTLSEDAKDEFLKRFIAEGKLLHQLSRATADVVQCLDVGFAVSPTRMDTPYLVLEWLDGTTLDRELKNSRGQARPIEDAMAVLEPAARGLAAAHDQGVSHRDVKPANLMLTEVGGRVTLKVVDFGIAKAPDDATTSSKPFDGFGSAMQAFTPRYGAPEQFSRKYGPTGTWTDVYSFALVLVELAAGVPALDGEDPVQLYIETSDVQNRPTLRARGVVVSDAIESVINRALTVDPRSRYRTMGEFWDALHAASGTQTTRIKSIRPPALSSPKSNPPVFRRSESDPIAPTPTGDIAGTITVMVREQRKRKIVWIAALLATGAMVAFAIVNFNQSSEQVLATSDAQSPVVPQNTVDSAIKTIADAAPPSMLPVAPATFTMGSDDGSKGERPAHPVTLTRAFSIDRTEVTTAAYGLCVTAGACTPNVLRKDGSNGEIPSTSCNPLEDTNYARQPVNCISYEQATNYCKWAGKRLPTEAEWEFSARGIDARTYPWGDGAPTSCRQAVVGGLDGPCGSRKGTYEVATTVDGVSPAGAFDMAGNVWEWVADAFESYPREGVVDPFLPPRSGTRGVLRGGSWDYSPTSAKTWTRLPIDRSWAQPSIGFRCVK